MITKNLFPVFIFLFVSVLFFSCGKEEALELDIFELKLKKVSDEYQLTWSPTNIASFESYILTYSPTPILPNEDPSSLNSDFKKVFTDQSDSIFFWRIPPNYPNFFFQVFAIAGDRIVRSNMIQIEHEDTYVLDFDMAKAIPYPKKNAIYLFDNDDQELLYYDFGTNKKKVSKKVGFYCYDVAVGNNGLGDELYIIKSRYELVTLDANTLEEKSTYTTSLPISAVASNGKGLIALSLLNKVLILNRNDWSTANSFSYSTTDVSTHGLVFLSQENNVLIETSRSRIDRYLLSDEGELLSHNFTNNPYESSSDNTLIVTSPGGNYFMNTEYGEIYDDSLNSLVWIYDKFNQKYASSLLSENGEVLYGIIPNGLEIHILNIFGSGNGYQYIPFYSNVRPMLLFRLNGKRMLVARKDNTNRIVIRPIF
ncbi:MAG: hypothetical protein AB8F94_02770 [Saprospiraceae bacterium]